MDKDLGISIEEKVHRIKAYLDETLTPEEEIEFQRWLDVSAANRVLLDRIRDERILLNKIRFAERNDKGKGWDNIQKKIRKSPGIFIRFMRYVAVLVTIMLIGVAVYQDKIMKGKGYRSNVAKAVWIVIVHLAAVAAVICAAFFVMIYQTGIRLDDRGKSYIQSEGFRERLNSRGTDILESLSAKEDINYLTNAGSSAVIDLAEFEEKEINRDSLSELSFKNTSGVAYSVKDLLEWAQDWIGVREGYDDGSLDDAGQFIQCKASDGSSYYFSLSDFKKLATDGTLKVNYDQDIMEEYDL